METISQVKGAPKLADDIAKCNNLGKAFEAEVAAKRVNEVAEVSKEITTSLGKTDIDVLLKDGTIIEAKTGKILDVDAQKQTEKFLSVNPPDKIEYIFKFQPDQSAIDFLNSKGITRIVVVNR